MVANGGKAARSRRRHHSTLHTNSPRRGHKNLHELTKGTQQSNSDMDMHAQIALTRMGSTWQLAGRRNANASVEASAQTLQTQQTCENNGALTCESASTPSKTTLHPRPSLDMCVEVALAKLHTDMRAALMSRCVLLRMRLLSAQLPALQSSSAPRSRVAGRHHPERGKTRAHTECQHGWQSYWCCWLWVCTGR